MDLEDVAQLASDQGRYLLQKLPEYDPALAIKLVEGLRQRGINPKLAAAALTQSRLRAGARTKFGSFADSMIFTDQGLQQSTRLVVAAHHAQRYLAAGIERVTDLTGGIGGDALAIAALGLRVTVYERDPVTAACASFNLAAFPEAKVVCANSLGIDLSHAEALFADPCRRDPQGQRRFDPAAYEPALDRLVALAAGYPLGLKVAPGIRHSAIPASAEAQWVSVDGDVVEAGLWFGPLRAAADRTALIIRRERAYHLAATGSERLPTGPLADFIYEPDGAVIRASLLAEAATTLGQPPGTSTGGAPPRGTSSVGTSSGSASSPGASTPGAAAPSVDYSLESRPGLSPALVSPRIAYITSGIEDARNPFLTGYRVIDTFDWGLKRLRGYLRERGIGQVVVKKRGTAVDPAELRKRLNLRGEASAVVILTRLGLRQSVVVAEPLRAPKEAT
ncbi:MAG: class I SAM-dependent methyltransferase [Bifidobacteriaceae bacterium]|nr:class I SAM-dependent methyltransferase [Bifidobacteriaceae bacterium]